MEPNGGLNADTPAGVAAISSTIGYYLNLRLLSKTQGVDVVMPAAMDQIVQLACTLPPAEGASWAYLAVGKVPTKGKAKAKKAAPAGDGEDGKQRSRGQWTEANKAEMVRLVEDVTFREDTLDKDATHQGHVNWAALARRYGFSGTGPIHRMYTAMTGKDPPGVVKRKEAGEGSEPAPKKAKSEAAPKAAAAPAMPSADGWTPVQCSELVKLVEDEAHRKRVTGKRHLKWSRVADALAKGKKESKKKYTAITGKEVDD